MVVLLDCIAGFNPFAKIKKLLEIAAEIGELLFNLGGIGGAAVDMISCPTSWGWRVTSSFVN